MSAELIERLRMMKNAAASEAADRIEALETRNVESLAALQAMMAAHGPKPGMVRGGHPTAIDAMLAAEALATAAIKSASFQGAQKGSTT